MLFKTISLIFLSLFGTFLYKVDFKNPANIEINSQCFQTKRYYSQDCINDLNNYCSDNFFSDLKCIRNNIDCCKKKDRRFDC